jgi:hypothetical protein
MTNRSLLARIGAKKVNVEVPKTVEESKSILKKDPDTGDIKSYLSLEDVLSEGFSRPNVLGALKNGNKYKGFLWEYAK